MKEKVLGRIYKHKRLYAWLMALIMVASLVVVPGGNNKVSANEGDSTELDPHFPVKVEIYDSNGTKIEPVDGKYNVKDDTNYNIKILFEEVPSTYQMKNGQDQVLTYKIPEGLKIPNASSQKVPVDVNTGDARGIYQLPNCEYYIEGGIMYFTWKYEGSTYQDKAFSDLEQSPQTSFWVELNGSFDSNKDKVVFGDRVSVDINVDTAKKLNVEKYAGEYNPTTGTIEYSIKVVSEGHNEAIPILDVISVPNNAFTLISDSINAYVENPYRTFSLSDYNPTATGFTGKIPELNNGETAQIKYKVKVDTTKLSGGSEEGSNLIIGTPSDMKNTVTITPDSEVGGTHEASVESTKITRPKVSKSSSGAVTADENGKATVEWTVTINSYYGSSMAGKTITDAITQATGTSSIVDGSFSATVKSNKVTADGGTQWGSDEPYTMSPTVTGGNWSYTFPASETPDENEVRIYTIKYKTEINIGDSIESVKVKNDVSTDLSPYDKSFAEVGIGPSEKNKPKLHKSVVSGSNTMEWTITIDVPSVGITTTDPLYIEDSLPKSWPDGVTSVDQIVDGSLSVTGMETGETYSVTYPSDSTDNVFKIYFTKNDRGTVKNGFVGTGSKRTITIKYKTNVNETWRNKAATDKTYEKHTNTVNLKGITVDGASATGTTSTPEIKKERDTTSSATAYNGMPMYKYKIILKDIDDSCLDASGNLVITDSFDGQYLALAENADISNNAWELGEYNKKIEGSTNETYGGAGRKNISVTAKDANTLEFKAAKSELLNSSSEYYAYYIITYYLYIKDDAAMASAAAARTDKTYNLINTATCDKIGSDSVTIPYVYNTLTKQQIDYDDTTNTAKFKLTINSAGLDLDPNNDMLKLTDDYTNLSVNFPSIEVTPDNKGAYWDASGNTLTFYIPDQTPVTIIYDAHVIGSGNVSYSNEASMLGETANEGKSVNIDRNQGGQAGKVGIKLMKYEGGHMNNPLSGVKFNLYDGVTDTYIASFTTDADGMIYIVPQAGDTWLLEREHKYYVVEDPTTTPSGYVPDTTKYQFTIAESDTDDNLYQWGSWRYRNQDTMTVKNELDKLSIPIQKKWVGETGDSATFALKMKVGDGALVAATDKSGNAVANLVLNGGNSWKDEFANLSRFKEGERIYYFVEEVDVPAGFTSDGGVRVDSSNEDRIDEGFVFTNYKTGTIMIRKDTENAPASAAGKKYELEVTSSDVADLSTVIVSNAEDVVKTADKVSFSIKADETATLSSLNVGTYTIKEKTGTTDKFTASYTVADKKTGDSDGSTNAVIKLATDRLAADVVVKNTYNDEIGKIELTKSVSGDVNADTDLAGLIFRVTNSSGDQVGPDYILGTDFKKTGTEYTKTISNLPVGTYYVEEFLYNVSNTSVVKKYSVNSGTEKPLGSTAKTEGIPVTDGGTTKVKFTNTYSKIFGELNVTKGTINRPDSLATAAYKITVKGEDGQILNNVTAKQGLNAVALTKNGTSVTFDLTTVGSVTLSNLPLGKYSVTEESDPAYVTVYKVGLGSDSNVAPTINLTADSEESKKASVTVTNTYNSDTTATLKIKKEIAAASGSTAPAAADVPKAFNFKLEKVTTGAPMPDAGGETLSNVGAEEKSFGVITYPGTTAENKEYIYKISETEITSTVADAERYSMPAVPSVYAKVKITGSGSARTTDVKYYSDVACTTELTGGAVITNTYTGENAVTAQLEITKDVTAASGVTVPRTIPNIFNFKLEAVDTAAPMPDGTGNILKNVGKETKKFGVITYSANGDYRYKISETGKDETNASAAEYLVSTAVVYAKVSVSGIGTSTPAATVKYYSNEACTTEITGTPTITNTYEKNVGKIKLRKTIEGPITETDKKGLTFEVYNNAGELQGKYVLGKDFTETTDSSGNTVYEKELSVAAGEGYYVVETLYEFDGTAVTVTYTVENEGKGVVDSDEALEGADGAETDPFEVKKGKTTTVTLNNVYEADTGYIDLTKTIKGDVTEEDLKGLTFEVLDGADKKWATFKLGEDFVKETDSTGKEIYRLKKKLEIGKGQYKIVEKLYKFDGSTVTVSYTVNEADGTITQGSGAETELSKVTGGKTTTFNYENDYKLDLVIKKVGKYNESCSSDSEATKPLVGVEFAIYDSTAPTVELAKKKTVDGGTVTFSNLDTGTYIIKETATIDDYVLLEDSYTVSVVSGKEPVLKDKDGNEVKDKTIVNDIYRADIKLLKVNESDTSEKLPSSTYGLYRTDASGKEELIAKNTTDSQGTLVFKGVKTGVDYTIKELEAPDGFYVSEQPIKVSFKVNENKEVVFDTAKFNTGNGTATVNEKGEITWLEPIVKASFAKVDKDGNALSGATLHVEDASGKVVESWTSGTSAHAIDGKLNCGQTYKLVEDKAPDGYKVADPISFSIDNEMGPNQEKVVTVTMTDEKKAETTDEEEEEEDEDEEEEEEEETTSTKKKTGSSSKTGDSAPIAGAAGALILSLCGAYVLLRKKER